MKKFQVLKISVLFGILAVMSGCSDDPEEIILDGITINGEGTTIKLSSIEVNAIVSDGATLSSSLISIDSDHEITDIGFAFSEENTLPTVDNMSISLGNVVVPQNLQANIEDLTPETLYYVRAYVQTASGVGYGNVVVFTTSGTPDNVIVINEGNFLSGDGSLSTFNSITGNVNLSVFASTNGFPIAATIQNTIVFDEKIFAVTNASDKLEVINLETFNSEALISSGFSNPFSFAAIGNKGYVTNWGTFNNDTFVFENSFITIIDLSTNSVVDSIDRAVQPQHVVAVGGFFYVSNVGGNTVTVFDPADDGVETDITVSSGPDRMVVDSGDDIWLICRSGDLVKIDTETNTVEKTISGVQVAGFNEKMVINDDGDQIYYLSSSGWPDYNTAIYSIGLEATSAPEDPIVSGTNYYGVGISPDDVLYVAEANAFQGNGSVIRYSLEGTEIDQFNAGRGPNGFIFR